MRINIQRGSDAAVPQPFLHDLGMDPGLQGKLPRKRGKKAKAYELFGEGKIPTSPEMKALGLHKSTRHKYFNAWIAAGRPLPLT